MRKFISVVLSFLFAHAIFAQTLQDAQKDIDNENYFKAKQTLFKLLKDGGESKADVAYYLGNAYLKTDDADSAKVFYKMVFSPDTRTALGYVANGRLALLSKNQADAQQNFDRALQTTKSKNANIFYEIGDAWFRPNIIDLPKAISAFEHAYDLDSKNTSIMLELGDAYLANAPNDPSMGGKAMNKYEAASELNKNLPLAWIKIGRLAVQGRIYNDAIDAFNKALAIDQSFPIIYKELAEVYYLTKQYDKVKPNFEKYLQLTPGDGTARATLASLYFQNKEYDKAIDEANKGLKQDPNNYIFQRIIAFSAYELKRYKDANEASQKFFSNPGKKVKDIDVIYAARISAQVGDTAKAMEMFQTILKNDSNNCDFLGEYAKILYISRRYSDAVNQYAVKKAKCGNLGSLEVYYLGRAYLILDDSIMADTTFGEFIQRNPTSPDGYFWRARTNLKFGKPEECLSMPYYLAFIDQAVSNVERNKNNLIEAYDYVGVCNFEKDKAKSKEYLQKALELDPNDPNATELLKQIK